LGNDAQLSLFVTTQQTIGGVNAFRKKQPADCSLTSSSRIDKSGGPETGSDDPFLAGSSRIVRSGGSEIRFFRPTDSLDLTIQTERAGSNN
jgi:hypothetical protein